MLIDIQLMYMPIFNANNRWQAELVARLVYCNPFLDKRVAVERELLEGHYVRHPGETWSAAALREGGQPNLKQIAALAERLCSEARKQLLDDSVRPASGDLALYEDVVLYTLYHQSQGALEVAIRNPGVASRRGLAAAYGKFVHDLDHYFSPPALAGYERPDAPHTFACFFQIRRAFEQIFHALVGGSNAMSKLRAAIWQSIFTHDMRRYRRSLYDKTAEFATLIVGPSGTGKELVARAIAESRYVPFDAKKAAFADDFSGAFFALNLSALTPTLIESELFGHRRGAFTGAVQDHAGWLQSCPPLGAVFLDEIGELDAAIQVKLLRLLQTRTFQRLGDTRTLTFRGKIIAATNRDLSREMRDGGFRSDFYYRLCSDIVTTPTLKQQVDDAPDELMALVRFIANRLIPEEADALAEQTLAAIGKTLGPQYGWPGNFRELEQCVRNVLIRGEYRPPESHSPDASDDLAAAFEAGALTADELLARYCRHMYDRCGTYEAAAKQLKMDRRTVRARAASVRDR